MKPLFAIVLSLLAAVGPSAAAGETRTVPARTSAMEQARRETVARDLKHVREMLQAAGPAAEYRQKTQAFFEENQTAFRSGATKWVKDAYYAAGPVAQNPRFGNFAEGILALRDYLKEQNVDLIVIRVPSRHEVAFPHFISGKMIPGMLDPAYLQLAEQLLAADVEYIDGLEAMHLHSAEYPLSYWYMLPREGHPAEGLSRILAPVIAERLARYQLPQTGEYRLDETADLYRKVSYPDGNPHFPAERQVSAARVIDAAGNVPSIEEINTSPILFVSDSYGAYPGVKAGASIPHYVAQLTGHLPDWLYRSGSSGGTPGFVFRKGEDFLKGRLAVVAICHPGNLFGVYGTIPSKELRAAPERWTVLKKFDAKNWTELPAEPAVGSHDRSFAPLPDGELQLWPLKEGAVNGNGGRLVFPLSREERETYRGFAVRLCFGSQCYLTVSVTAGAGAHHEYVSVSDFVPELFLPVAAAPETENLTLNFQNVSIRGKTASSLKSVELLGLNR